MSPYNYILDFEKMRTRTKDDDEKQFLETFQRASTVIYDWGHAMVWVIDGDSEEDEENLKKRHAMSDDRLIEELGQINMLTSADVVTILLCNDKNVDIRRVGSLDSSFTEHYRQTAQEITGREAPKITVRS